MDLIFPIRYTFTTGKIVLNASSSTVPFRVNGEWFAINQEIVGEVQSYTITKLFGSLENYNFNWQNVDFNELSKVINFMMKIAIEHQKLLAMHPTNQQQNVIEFPTHSNIIINNRCRCHKNNEALNTLQFDRSTSTSADLLCPCFSPVYRRIHCHDNIVPAFAQTSSTGTQAYRHFIHLGNSDISDSQC